MSRERTERIKAVRKAWEREQQLVSKGEGTRDWTLEQQQSILNIGVALDDEGRPFEGQHMKSVGTFPEHAGNPDNIQFLTRQEHLQAHKGNWQNPTNWFYNPESKEYLNFKGDELVPCKIGKLSNPIIAYSSKDAIIHEKEPDWTDNDKISSADILAIRVEEIDVSSAEGQPSKSPQVTDDVKILKTIKISKRESKFVRAVNSVGKFVINHPAESFWIAKIIAGRITKNTTINESGRASNALTSAGVNEKPNRASPREHVVPRHGQNYHTKGGTIWKEKPPYSRGGKKE